jgi:hypothetical protein
MVLAIFGGIGELVPVGLCQEARMVQRQQHMTQTPFDFETLHKIIHTKWLIQF